MSILQKVLDRISPKSFEAELREGEKYRERRRRRLSRIGGTAGPAPPDADDLAGWLGLSGGNDGDGS